MPLEFVKKVQIHNPRLSLLHKVVWLFLLTCVIYSFIIDQKWNVDIRVRGSAILWVTGYQNHDSLKQVQASKEMDPLCTRPHEYDYWYDAHGVFSYTNYSCMELCDVNQADNECINQFGTFTSFGPDSSFILTSFSEVFFWGNASTSKAAKRYMVVTGDALSIGMQYYASVPGPQWWGLFSGATRSDRALTSFNHLHTVLMFSDGSMFKEITPRSVADGDHPAGHLHQEVLHNDDKEGIVISFPELLRMAAVDLDDAHVLAGRNYFTSVGKYANGPITRISGLDIRLVIKCYNYAHEKQVDLGWTPSDEWPVCYIRAVRSEIGWMTSQVLDYVDSQGSLRRRSLQGVRVQADILGFFQMADSVSVYNFMISSVVLLSLPKMVLFFFVVTCLGHLSKIYRRATVEQFSISQQCGGLTTRLLANSSAFGEITDTNADGGGITRNRMKMQLKHVFRKRTKSVDQQEIDCMTDFCFRNILRHKDRQAKGPLAAIHDRLANLGRESCSRPRFRATKMQRSTSMLSPMLPHPSSLLVSRN